MCSRDWGGGGAGSGERMRPDGMEIGAKKPPKVSDGQPSEVSLCRKLLLDKLVDDQA